MAGQKRRRKSGATLADWSGPEREKQLLSGAKNEGKAVLYGNLNAEQLEKLEVDFKSADQLELKVYRASGERISNRLMTEARGGQFLADVVGLEQ